ncbi:hypothetical protein Bhyg_12267 [Pseudolycoriella hygida]|uniref:PHD-type domain-containing protein n=1 Tax=Pseudolycoriella hygida TaxID=35572 RepID=A0A9Q0MWW2_9DIPT|nr:hypothetical protein Bhyg_12267 [Pseudolycoriella hygida]
MVQCDQCDIWCHFSCVDLVSITEEESWMCPNCVDILNTVVEECQTLTNSPVVVQSQVDAGSLNERSNSRHDTGHNNDEAQQVNAQGNLTSLPNARPQSRSEMYNHNVNSQMEIFYPNNSTFHCQNADRRLATAQLMPIGLQGVVMDPRLFAQYRVRPQLIHSTPVPQWNRFVVLHQRSNRPEVFPVAHQGNRSQQSNRPEAVLVANQENRSQQSNRPEPLSVAQEHRSQQLNRSMECLERNSAAGQQTLYYTANRDNKSEVNSVEVSRQQHSSQCEHPTVQTANRQNGPPSVKSSIRTASTSRFIQIELQRLEEEHRAHKEYIKQKYRILTGECDDREFTDRRKFTEQWIDETSHDRLNEFLDDDKATRANPQSLLNVNEHLRESFVEARGREIQQCDSIPCPLVTTNHPLRTGVTKFTPVTSETNENKMQPSFVPMRAQSPSSTEFASTTARNHLRIVATVTEPVFTASEEKDKNSKKSSENSKKKTEYFNVHHESTKSEIQSAPKVQKEGDSSNRQSQPKICAICQKSCVSVADCAEFKSKEVSQRWKLVNSKKLCRMCLRLHFGFCRTNKHCGVNTCTRKHHPLLHDDLWAQRKSANKPNTTLVELNHPHFKINTRVLLRFVPVKLFGVGCSINTFAFLDEGSTTTLIDRKLAEKLKIKGKPKKLCLLWSGRYHRTENSSYEISDIGISSVSKDAIKYHLKDVKTVDDLGIPVQRLNKSELVATFPYLRNVPFEDYENGLAGILIGLNNPKIGIPLEIVEGAESGPIATRARIGWTVHGPTYKSETMSEDEVEPLSLNYHSVKVQYANKSMLWRPASAVARLDVLAKDGLTAEGHCSETEGSVEKATTKRKSARIAERNNKEF